LLQCRQVDKSILEAKKALLDVTQDFSERTQRWRQIEALCGCPIMTNPGLGLLKTMVKNIGITRMMSSASMARIFQDQSPEDGSSNDDPMEDARSVAASRSSTLTTSATMPSLTTLKSAKSSTRHTILESSRESLLNEEGKGWFQSFHEVPVIRHFAVWSTTKKRTSCIFSFVRPFNERAVSDLDRSMHRSLWV